MEPDNLYIQIIKRHAVPLKPIPAGTMRAGSKKPSIRVVFFDLYGTLFISGSGDVSCSKERIDEERFGTLLKRYGILSNHVTILQGYFDEIKSRHAFLRRLGVDYPEVQVEKVWMKVLGTGSIARAREFAVEFESLFNPVWPMPAARDLLRYLKGKGIKLGIISNAQFFSPLLFPALMGSSLRGFGFFEDLLLYSFKYEHAKPSPFLYCRAKLGLSRLNIAPEQALYVGNDMLNDIYPASTAGFCTALFAGDKRSLRLRRDDPQCAGVIPDITVTDLKELTEYLI